MNIKTIGDLPEERRAVVESALTNRDESFRLRKGDVLGNPSDVNDLLTLTRKKVVHGAPPLTGVDGNPVKLEEGDALFPDTFVDEGTVVKAGDLVDKPAQASAETIAKKNAADRLYNFVLEKIKAATNAKDILKISMDELFGSKELHFRIGIDGRFDAFLYEVSSMVDRRFSEEAKLVAIGERLKVSVGFSHYTDIGWVLYINYTDEKMKSESGS